MVRRSPGEKQPALCLGKYQLCYQKYLKQDSFQTWADSHGSCLQVCLHLWCRHGLGLDMIRAFNQNGIFLTQFLPLHSAWHPAPNSHSIFWSGLDLCNSHPPSALPYIPWNLETCKWGTQHQLYSAECWSGDLICIKIITTVWALSFHSGLESSWLRSHNCNAVTVISVSTIYTAIRSRECWYMAGIKISYSQRPYSLAAMFFFSILFSPVIFSL